MPLAFDYAWPLPGARRAKTSQVPYQRPGLGFFHLSPAYPPESYIGRLPRLLPTFPNTPRLGHELLFPIRPRRTIYLSSSSLTPTERGYMAPPFPRTAHGFHTSSIQKAGSPLPISKLRRNDYNLRRPYKALGTLFEKMKQFVSEIHKCFNY